MTEFDPERIEDARERIAEALDEAAYHEAMAHTLKSKAALLARTWKLEPPQ